MKYLSLFSGIEAATVGWHHLGWECVGVSEIDPFACEVLKQRLPNIQNLGDISKISKEHLNEIKTKNGTIDIVVGGSPCQSFSIAGLRKGLEDPRGNLMLEYIRVVSTIRPTYFVWENVPGVLSSNQGRDFGTLLQAMEKLGYNMCWRTLDSKNFGVPQRRRRVFLIGSTRNGKHPFKILFEPKSLQRNHTKSKETRKDNTTKTTASTQEHDRIILLNPAQPNNPPKATHHAPSLIARMGTGGNQVPLIVQPNATMGEKVTVADETFAHSSYSNYAQSNIGGTLKANGGDCLGGETLVTEKSIGKHDKKQSVIMLQNNQNDAGILEDAKTSYTLTAAMGEGGGHVPMIVFPNLQKNTGTLMASDAEYKLDHQTVVSEKLIVEKQYASTLCARDSKGVASDSFGHNYQQLVNTKTKVRRLTPIECERLQGFPDNWTQISWKGKEPKNCPVSHRYKCLGNSMTTNVMRWIGERIAGVPTTIYQKKN